MGEPRALDARLDGGPWRIGVARPDALSQIADTLEIIDKAGSTSGAYGFRFDPAGRFNHLFDPRTGSPSMLHASVTAVMPTATAADALSTAFSLMSREEIARVLGIVRGKAYLITYGGERLPLGG